MLPSMKHQALAQQLQPSQEPAWCRSQLHLGVTPWELQTHSWRCLGICNFQQELGAPSTSPGPSFGHPPLPTGERVEPCEEAAARVLSVLLQTEGRAGFCDRIKICFFAKTIPKPQIPGTVPQSSQEGWEHPSWCHPNLPFPAREFADLPFALQTRRKKRDFSQFGDVSPGMAPSSGFLQCPVAACCSPGSSTLQAGRQARGTRQFSVLQ